MARQAAARRRAGRGAPGPLQHQPRPVHQRVHCLRARRGPGACGPLRGGLLGHARAPCLPGLLQRDHLLGVHLPLRAQPPGELQLRPDALQAHQAVHARAVGPHRLGRPRRGRDDGRLRLRRRGGRLRRPAVPRGHGPLAVPELQELRGRGPGLRPSDDGREGLCGRPRPLHLHHHRVLHREHRELPQLRGRGDGRQEPGPRDRAGQEGLLCRGAEASADRQHAGHAAPGHLFGYRRCGH
mmetsp:Transcript_42780/g.135947  ORF Transcript_42780/g.135947 Transcript_42780/m.135947 type:complete len:240 (+) Transcript_42780:2-721(+)